MMTSGVRVSSDFGIVIRRGALSRVSLSDEALCELMETPKPLDADDELVSFGPHFGIEAAREFGRRLDARGLVYADDYFILEELVPEWCELRCHEKATG